MRLDEPAEKRRKTPSAGSFLWYRKVLRTSYTIKTCDDAQLAEINLLLCSPLARGDCTSCAIFFTHSSFGNPSPKEKSELRWKRCPYYLSEGDCKWVEETIAGMSVVSAGCLMRGCSYNNVTIQGLTLYKIVV